MPNDCQRQAITLDERGKVLFELAVSLETWHGNSRFPAFWGPNVDWIPDQDHGSVALIALQTMLLQSEDRKTLLLPAWPRNRSVDFKLHAPLQTTVEGSYQDGELIHLRVTPESRTKVFVFPAWLQ